MARILITGAAGRLGQALVRCLREPPAGVLFACTRADLDVTDPVSTAEVIAAAAPDVVIHAAAFTDVDACERKPEQAFLVNAQGTSNVASACRRAGARLVYLSTDYVFDGEKGAPYRETDSPRPLNVYGDSKLRGEGCVGRTSPDFLIVRTSWLFDAGGMGFVAAVRRLAERKAPFPVVRDQVGSPTWAADLARALRLLVEGGVRGIVHVCNRGSCSRYEWARRIVDLSGMDPGLVRPSTSGEVPRPAERPKYSVLDCSLLVRTTGWSPFSWEEALSTCLQSPASGETARRAGGGA